MRTPRANRLSPRRCAGTTLFETLVAVSLGSIVSAGVLTGLSVLQRTWAAAESYAVAQGTQVLLLDTLALDVRRALSVAVVNNVLTLTLPDYLNNGGAPAGPNATPVDPVVVGNNLTYGNKTFTVRYYQQGAALVRSVPGQPPQAVAGDVADFQVTDFDVGDQVTCALTFSPRFTLSPSAGAVASTFVYSRTFLRNHSARP